LVSAGGRLCRLDALVGGLVAESGAFEGIELGVLAKVAQLELDDAQHLDQLGDFCRRLSMPISAHMRADRGVLFG
jgi:hypothetical protein